MEVPQIKNTRSAIERVEKFISDEFFTDVNIKGKVYLEKRDITGISHLAAPGRITYDEALASTDWAPAVIGDSFGPTWSTHWFKLTISYPAEWVGNEIRLRWNTSSEGMVWEEGVPMQGLNGKPGNMRTDYILTQNLTTGLPSRVIYIEMACNNLFGAGDGNDIAPPDPNRYYTLDMAEISVFNRPAYDLVMDFDVLHDIMKTLPTSTDLRAWKAMYTANEMINMLDTADPSTYQAARDHAQKFFSATNGEMQHVVHAIGNTHIDTAWLWPYDETKRKCARSFSTALQLMQLYPDMTFACSQAQQLKWVKENYPELFVKLQEASSMGGRFLTVGGTWIEMDGNVPSGESFIRQFAMGQKFFEKEFGKKCTVFWLPDTFGYSAQLPQIVRLAGIKNFLSQKMSWNLVNTFPNNSFYWEGIDGSRVLTHFPPADTYVAEAYPREVVKCSENNKDKGRADCSILLYGFGDGGGGPTENMLERLNRQRNTDGIPKVTFSSPDAFYAELEMVGEHLSTWIGELYLELHNGTYTTMAQIKMLNRACEMLLQQWEFLQAMLSVQPRISRTQATRAVPASSEAYWEILLLNQFHDVLPGTSIEMVCVEAVEMLTKLRDELARDVEVMRLQLLMAAPAPAPRMQPVVKRPTENHGVANSLCWPRTEVVTLDGDRTALVVAPSMGIGPATSIELSPDRHAKIFDTGSVIVISNEHLAARFDNAGRLVSLTTTGVDKELIAGAETPANQFVMFDDVPLFWDAWDVMDYHLQTRKPLLNTIARATVLEDTPQRVSFRVTVAISDDSSIQQTISLDASCPFIRCHTEVEWHENRKFLKVEFPLNVHTTAVTYDIQFGHLQRPNHMNTSWDTARYEVCGHKWADMSETGVGVALLNDCKYGYSCYKNVLRLSLLRAPKSPNANSDIGKHEFTYAIMPHKGTFQSAGVVQQAYNLNSPLGVARVSVPVTAKSWLSVDNPAVVLETVKKDEMNPEAIIVRMYEAYGSTAHATINVGLPVQKVFECDIFEKDDSSAPYEVKNSTFQVKLTPFQVKTVKCWIMH